MSSQAEKTLYEFGPFRLDPTKRRLLRDGAPVTIQPKALELLLALIERRQQVLGKDELMNLLWPDAIVEESNLTVSMSVLRKALGEQAQEHRYIVTVPGRGYRFVAEVRPVLRDAAEGEAELIVQKSAKVSLVEEEEEQSEGMMEAAHALTAASAHPLTRPRRVWLAVALLAVLIAGATVWWKTKLRGAEPAAPAGAIKSIAVLPFKPLSPDRSDEYLGLGMADTLITRLSNLRQVSVRPTSVVRKYTAQERDPMAVGRELQVEAVLEGSIRRAGERVRVTVQMVSVGNGTPLWAEKFDEQFTDIFTLEDSISEKVAEALRLKLAGAERKLLTKRYTQNAEAYQAYLKGRYFWDQRTPEGIQKGVGYFEQAIDKDPSYALAYAGLADAYSLFGFGSQGGGLSPGEAFPKARAAAMQALAIDDTLAEAHAALALVRMRYDWDWSGAEKEAQRAIELNPDYATAREYYAGYLIAQGRQDEAIAEIKRAQELDPLSLRLNAVLGLYFYYTRQSDAAVEQLRRTIEMDPHFLMAHFFLGLAYEQKGMYEQAIAELHQAITPAGGSPETIAAGLGHVYAASGKREQAQQVLAELLELRKRRYVSPYNIAKVYTGLGEKEHAFAWWQKASEERSYGLIFAKVDPVFDSLRSDPRFTDLLRRVGLQP